jgi:hypothetical protein
MDADEMEVVLSVMLTRKVWWRLVILMKRHGEE